LMIPCLLEGLFMISKTRRLPVFAGDDTR